MNEGGIWVLRGELGGGMDRFVRLEFLPTTSSMRSFRQVQIENLMSQWCEHLGTSTGQP